MTGITWCSAAVLSGMNPYHSGKRRDMAFMDLHMVRGSAVALSTIHAPRKGGWLSFPGCCEQI